MDPLTALLFSLWIAGYFTRNVYEDAVFKARGEDPPSFRRQQQRWERQQARRDRGPGPARKVFSNVWADAWAQADERRARRVEKAAQKRRAKEELAAAEEEAYTIHERLNATGGAAEPHAPVPAPMPKPPMPSCSFCGREMYREKSTFVRDGDQTVLACSSCRAQREPAPKSAPPDASVAPPTDPAAPRQFVLTHCVACGRTNLPLAEFDGHPRCEDCIRLQKEANQPPATPAPSTPATTDAIEATADAEIIQFADWQHRAAEPTSKEKDMSAEITGLRSAIAFANGSASASEAAAAQVELAISGLQTGGTSGPAVAALQAAAESHHTTAAHYRDAAATLTQQLQVAEAYEANQGAGTREFVTSE